MNVTGLGEDWPGDPRYEYGACSPPACRLWQTQVQFSAHLAFPPSLCHFKGQFVMPGHFRHYTGAV